MAFVLTAQVILQAPQNASAVVNQINRQLSGLNANVNVQVNPNSQKEVAKLNNSVKQIGASAKDAGNTLEAFGKQSALAIRRFGAFVIATVAFRAFISNLKEAFGEAIKFERELVKIAQVTNSSISSLRGLTDEIGRLSTSFGVSSGILLEASRTLAQTGLAAKDVTIALSALAKSDLAPTFEDIIKTTEGSIAIFRQFGVEAKELEGVLGSINAVSGKFAVESGDLIAAVRRTGGAFAAAGGELNELIALFTSVRSTTRESAESIATGFRTIFTRLQRASTISFLEELGIKLRDVEGQFIGPFEAVRKLNKALSQLESTDPRFAKIVEELGGFRQVSKVIPLIQQFETAQRALGVAQAGTGSLAEDAAKAQGVLSIQITKTKEEFLKLIRSFSDDTTIRASIALALDLAKALIKIAEATKPLIPLLAAAGTAFLATGFRTFLGSVSKGTGFLGGAKGFAHGGIVPGVGSGDTVPAMLEPGEFVIKKDAVQAIGQSKLNGINKFARGGRVRFADAGAVEGLPSNIQLQTLADLSPSQKSTLTEALKKDNVINVSKPLIEINGKKIRVQAGAKKALLSSNKKGKIIPKRAKITLGSPIDPAFGGLFLEPITDGNSGVQDSISFGPGTKASSQERFQKIAKNLSKFVSGVEAQDVVEVVAPLDFATVTPKAAKTLQEQIGRGAKSLISNISESVAQQINLVTQKTDLDKLDFSAFEGIAFEGLISSLTGAPLQKKGATFDFPTGIGSSALFPNAKEGIVREAKKRLSTSVIQTSNDGSIGRKIRTTIAEEGSNVSLSSIGSKIKKLAHGGNVGSGKDTIPALLTPGEFVINKKAADRIGLSGLNKLNNAEKFAKGGPVRLADGGAPSGGGGGGGFEKLFLFGAIVPQVVASLGEMSDGTQKVTGLLTTFGTQVVVLSSILKSIDSSGFGTGGRNLAEAGQFRETSKEVTTSLPAELAKQKKLDEEIAQLGSKRDKLRQSIGNAPAGAITTARQSQLDKTNDSLINRGNASKELNNEIVARKKHIKALDAGAISNEKAAASSQKFAQGLAIASAAALVAAQFFADSSAQKLAAGDIEGAGFDARVSGTLGGAGKGAAAGFAVGSVVPVLGTAIGTFVGAVIGGGAGFLKASDDFVTAVKKQQIVQSLEKLNEAFIQVKNGVDARLNVGAVKTGVKALASAQSGLSGADLVEFNQSLNKSTKEISLFVSEIAKNTDTFDELTKIIDKGTLRQLARFQNIKFSTLKSRIEEQIKVQNAANKVTVASTQAALQFNQRLLSISGFEAALNLAGSRLQFFGNLLDGLSKSGNLDVKGGGTSLIRSGVQSADTALFADALGKIETQVSTGGLAVEAAAGNEAVQALPDSILRAIQTAPLGENFTSVLNDILKQDLSGVAGGDFAREQIISKARSLGGSEPEILARARDNPAEFVKELAGTFTPLTDILANVNEKLNESFALLGRGLTLRRQANLSTIKQSLAIEDTLNSLETFRAGFDERPLDFSSLRIGEEDRFKSILGSPLASIASAPKTTGVGGQASLLADASSNASDAIQKFNRELRDNSFKDVSQREAVLRSLDKEITKRDRANKALDFLADASKRTAIAQKELSEIRGNRQTKFNFASDFAFGTEDSKLSQARNVRGAELLSSGAVGINDINEEFRGGIREFLRQFSKVELFGSGKTGRDIERDVVSNELLRADKAAGGTLTRAKADEIALKQVTPEEEKLRKEIVDGFDISVLAQEKVLNETIRIGNILETIATQGFKLSIKDIQTTAKQNITTRLSSAQIRQASLQGTQNKLQGFDVESQSDLDRRKRATQAAKEFQDVSKKREELPTAAELLDRVKQDFTVNGEGEDRLFAKGSSAAQDKADKILDDFSETFNKADFEKLREALDGVVNDTSVRNAIDTKGSFSDDFASIAKSIVKPTKKRLSVEQDEITSRIKAQGFDPNLDVISELVSTSDAFDLVSKSAKDFASAGTTIEGIPKAIAKSTAEINRLKQELANVQSGAPPTVQRAHGGFIPGSGNGDTVPALLTPGEFVINKQSARAIGRNRLDQLNSANVSKFAHGGSVGNISGGAGSITIETGLTEVIANFLTGANTLATALDTFSRSDNPMIKALSNIPTEIAHTFNGQVEVIINGADVLSNIQPELRRLITSEIKTSLNKMLNDKFPDVGNIV